jgi:hypothetical protein
MNSILMHHQVCGPTFIDPLLLKALPDIQIHEAEGYACIPLLATRPLQIHNSQYEGRPYLYNMVVLALFFGSSSFSLLSAVHATPTVR